MPDSPQDAQPDANGVLWSYQLRADGSFETLTTDPLAPSEQAGDFAWVHMILDAEGSGAWLRRQGFSEDVVEAMTTIGTRPALS